MARGPLCEPGLCHGISHGFLYQGFVNMMATLFFGLAIDPSMFLGKDPLPAPFLRRVGVLSVEGIRKQDAAPPVGYILLVHSLDLREVFLKRRLERFG